MTQEEINELRKYDTVPVHGLTPEQIRFCGWVHLSWGWKCWINSDIATYNNKIVQDGFGEPPIRFRKEMLTVAQFKEKKLKALRAIKIAKQKQIAEKADKL